MNEEGEKQRDFLEFSVHNTSQELIGHGYEKNESRTMGSPEKEKLKSFIESLNKPDEKDIENIIENPSPEPKRPKLFGKLMSSIKSKQAMEESPPKEPNERNSPPREGEIPIKRIQISPKDNHEGQPTKKSLRQIIARKSIQIRQGQTGMIGTEDRHDLVRASQKKASMRMAVRDFSMNFDCDSDGKDVFTGSIYKKQFKPGQQGEESCEEHFEYLKRFHEVKKTKMDVIRSVIPIFSDFIQTVLAFASIIIYILQTYGYSYSDSSSDEDEGISWLTVSDGIVTSLGTLDYLHSLLTADHKIKHLFLPQSLLDLITMLPFYLSYIQDSVSIGLSFFNVLQIFKLLRILRLYRLFKGSTSNSEASIYNLRYLIVRQTAILLCSVIAVLFIASGVFKEMDAIWNYSYSYYPYSWGTSSDYYMSDSSWRFQVFDGFYLMCQVLFTEGFGDLYPVSVPGRILLVVFLFVLILVAIYQLNKVRELYVKLSPYDYEYPFKNHFIIIGDLNDYSVYKFLYEAVQSIEIRKDSKKFLIISKSEPSETMVSILQSAILDGKAKYIVSDLSQASLLDNCRMLDCKGIFMFNDHIKVDGVEAADGDSMLMLKGMHDYLPYVRKIVQLNDLESVKTTLAHLNSIPFTTVYPTRFIKAKILANSIFSQGVTTIFGNLCLSMTTSPVISNMDMILWYLEYGKSICQEVFCVKISHFFKGFLFQEICMALANDKKGTLASTNILLIGVKSFSITNEKGLVLINPFKYRIKEGDFGLVIAPDISSAEVLSDYDGEGKEEAFDFGSQSDTRQVIGVQAYLHLNNAFRRKKKQEQNYTLSFPDRIFCSSYTMWNTDFNGKLAGHIILVCPIEYFSLCADTIRTRTMKPIVFLNEKPPNSLWSRVSAQFSNCLYCQCDTFDIEQLSNLAINNAFHVLIFSLMDSSSISPDSKTLLLVNTIDCFFDVEYTFELFDEKQIRFLGNRARDDLETLRYSFLPRLFRNSGA